MMSTLARQYRCVRAHCHRHLWKGGETVAGRIESDTRRFIARHEKQDFRWHGVPGKLAPHGATRRLETTDSCCKVMHSDAQ